MRKKFETSFAFLAALLVLVSGAVVMGWRKFRRKTKIKKNKAAIVSMDIDPHDEHLYRDLLKDFEGKKLT